MLPFLAKLNGAPQEVAAGDVRALRAAGIPDAAIRDAIHLCAGYNVIDRIADSFGFALPDEAQRRGMAKYLLRIGYRA